MSGSLKSLHDMTIDEISLVDDPCDPEAIVKIVKLRPGGGNEGGNEMTLEELNKKLGDVETNMVELEKGKAKAEADCAEMKKRADEAEAEVTKLRGELAAATAARDEAIAKAKPSEDVPADGVTESVLKSLPEAARDAILKARETVAKAETDTFIAKARDLGIGKADDLGPLLQRIAKGKTTAADLDTIEGVLKAAKAQSTPLFKSFGSDVKVEGDPEQLLKAKAEEIRKNKPELTEAQAFAQAMDAHPELYSAYSIQKRKQAAGQAD